MNPPPSSPSPPPSSDHDPQPSTPSPDVVAEIGRSLLASWHVLMGRRDLALKLFNLSEQGFWRSFLAFPVALPIYLLAVRMGVPAAVETEAQRAMLGFVLFKATFMLALEWVAWLVAVALLLKPLGLAQHYGRYVIVYNWSSPLILALQAVPTFLYFNGLITREAATFIFLFLLGLALYLRWQNARIGLEAPGMLAFGFVLADVLLSVLINRLIGGPF